MAILCRFWAQSLVAGSLAGAWSAPAVSQCLRYSVDIIPGPDCPFVGAASFALGLNSIGDLSGGYTPCSKSANGASVWLGEGDWINFPPNPFGQYVAESDINSARQIATTYELPDPNPVERAAFIDFDTMQLTPLGVLPGDFESEAVGISESGIVCATSYHPLGGSRIFVWQNGITTILNIPMGPYAVAHDISDTHLVCGLMGVRGSGVAHAFTHNLDTGQTLDIGIPLATIYTARATGVNSQGNVCGWGFQPCAPSCGLRRGFFWSNGAAVDVGMLPKTNRCTPRDLNDDNVVVGFCTSQTELRAFVWRDGVMYDLLDLIPEELNLWGLNANAINNAGQIAAYGNRVDTGDTVALRLTPVPPQPGDCTCDWLVNSDDLMAVIRNWGECPPEFTAPCTADLNNDHRVNVPDLLNVLNHWGQGRGIP